MPVDRIRRTRKGTVGLSLLALVALSVPAAGGEASRAEEDAILQKAQILSKAFAIVARRVMPSVVNIQVERTRTVRSAAPLNNPFSLFPDHMLRRFFSRPRERKYSESGLGSGVILDAQGHIVTNHHVVGDADVISVRLRDGREYDAELIGSSPESDLAVLKIDAPNLVPAPLGDSDDCEVGEFVLAIGNSFGLESTVTNGMISAKGRSGVGIVDYEDFIQTDAAINPGNSGGPLVNLKGEVIGLNTALFSKAGGYQGIGFAIPSNIVRFVMSAIINHKRVVQSYLGVDTQSLTPELAESFGLQTARGALITEVLAETPAAKAGIQRGDVILRYGKREIADDQHLRNLVATTPPDEEVEITLARQGRERVVRVELEPISEEFILSRGQEFLDNLGIEVVNLTPKLRRRYGYEPDAEGVLVTRVAPRSMAARIRIHAGALILRINGEAILTVEALSKSLALAQDRRTTRPALELIWRSGRYVLRNTLRFVD